MVRRRLHVTFAILLLALLLGVRLHFVIIVCIHQRAPHRRHASPVPPATRGCTVLGHLRLPPGSGGHSDV